MNEEEGGQLDIFFVGELTAPASKNDIGSMEHPMFSIKKGGDRDVRRYEHNGYWIEITPSVRGSATIWDKDIVIYLSTAMRLLLDRGETVPEVFEVLAADLLRGIGRDDSGKTYSRLYDALDRLRGTNIKTNLPTGLEKPGEEPDYWNFSILNDVKVFKSKGTKRLTRLVFQPSGWFRQQVESKRLLTIDPEYFQLESGLLRRLYELARKHCGKQARWNIRLPKLQHKVGSDAKLNRFRFDLKEAIEKGGGTTGFLKVISYFVVLTDDDMVHVFADDERGRLLLTELMAQIADAKAAAKGNAPKKRKKEELPDLLAEAADSMATE